MNEIIIKFIVPSPSYESLAHSLGKLFFHFFQIAKLASSNPSPSELYLADYRYQSQHVNFTHYYFEEFKLPIKISHYRHIF